MRNTFKFYTTFSEHAGRNTTWGVHEFREWELAFLENESLHEAKRNSEHEGKRNGPLIFNILIPVKKNGLTY